MFNVIDQKLFNLLYRLHHATGLVSLKGKRLILNDKKLTVINEILAEGRQTLGSDAGEDYLTRLWNGSDLPTDNEVIGVLPTKSGKHTLSKIRHKESRFFLR